MRLAIVGPRDYPDQEQVREYVRALPDGTVLVNGRCKEGVDDLVFQEAKARGLEVIEAPPIRAVYGPRRAPWERNRTVVNACDELVAFVHEPTPGTQNAVALAARAGKLRGIIRPRGRVG